MSHLQPTDDDDLPPIEATDVFGLHRGYLFDWDADLEAHARAFGEALADQGLSGPMIVAACCGVGHLLGAHWESEADRPKRAAYARGEEFARLAYEACFAELRMLVAADNARLH